MIFLQLAGCVSGHMPVRHRRSADRNIGRQGCHAGIHHLACAFNSDMCDMWGMRQGDRTADKSDLRPARRQRSGNGMTLLSR